jgi:hypothetical protein
MTEEREKTFRFMIEFPNGAKIYSNDVQMLSGTVEKCLKNKMDTMPTGYWMFCRLAILTFLTTKP